MRRILRRSSTGDAPLSKLQQQQQELQQQHLLPFSSPCHALKKHQVHPDVSNDSFQDTTAIFRPSIRPAFVDELPLQKLRMLVVDDVELNRKMMVRIMTVRGFHCDQAVDGLDAIEKCKAAIDSQMSYHVITMDYQMPNMDGALASQHIRAMKYTGLIIGVTGNVLESDQQRFMSHGVDTVMTKPFDLIRFDKLVRESLTGVRY